MLLRVILLLGLGLCIFEPACASEAMPAEPESITWSIEEILKQTTRVDIAIARMKAFKKCYFWDPKCRAILKELKSIKTDLKKIIDKIDRGEIIAQMILGMDEKMLIKTVEQLIPKYPLRTAAYAKALQSFCRMKCTQRSVTVPVSLDRQIKEMAKRVHWSHEKFNKHLGYAQGYQQNLSCMMHHVCSCHGTHRIVKPDDMVTLCSETGARVRSLRTDYVCEKLELIRTLAIKFKDLFRTFNNLVGEKEHPASDEQRKLGKKCSKLHRQIQELLAELLPSELEDPVIASVR